MDMDFLMLKNNDFKYLYLNNKQILKTNNCGYR
jgi:hypothetical protein